MRCLRPAIQHSASRPESVNSRAVTHIPIDSVQLLRRIVNQSIQYLPIGWHGQDKGVGCEVDHQHGSVLALFMTIYNLHYV